MQSKENISTDTYFNYVVFKCVCSLIFFMTDGLQSYHQK